MNRVANGIRSEVLASIAEMKDGEYVKECDIHTIITQVYHSFWQTLSPVDFWLYAFGCEGRLWP